MPPCRRCRGANILHPAAHHDQQYCGAQAGGEANQHNGPVYNIFDVHGDCYCSLCSILCCSLKSLCPDWLAKAWRRVVAWLLKHFVGKSDDPHCSCSSPQPPAATSSSLPLQSLLSPPFVGSYPRASDPGTTPPYSLPEDDDEASQCSSHRLRGRVERRPDRSVFEMAAGAARVVSTLATKTYVVEDGGATCGGLRLVRSGPARLESPRTTDDDIAGQEQRDPEQHDRENGDLGFE